MRKTFTLETRGDSYLFRDQDGSETPPFSTKEGGINTLLLAMPQTEAVTQDDNLQNVSNLVEQVMDLPIPVLLDQSLQEDPELVKSLTEFVDEFRLDLKKWLALERVIENQMAEWFECIPGKRGVIVTRLGFSDEIGSKKSAIRKAKADVDENFTETECERVITQIVTSGIPSGALLTDSIKGIVRPKT